jgi:hypothetical protein
MRRTLRRGQFAIVWYAVIALFCCISTSHAQLLGTDVRVDWRFPQFGTTFASVTRTAIAGPEINCPGSQGPGDTPEICRSLFGGPFVIDLAASSVTVYTRGNSFAPSLYNGFAFTFAPGTPKISGVTLVTNNPSATSARTSSTGNSVAINLASLDTGPTPHFYTLNITFAPAATPVPTTGPLSIVTLAALLVLAATRRLHNPQGILAVGMRQVFTIAGKTSAGPRSGSRPRSGAATDGHETTTEEAFKTDNREPQGIGWKG